MLILKQKLYIENGVVTSYLFDSSGFIGFALDDNMNYVYII